MKTKNVIKNIHNKIQMADNRALLFTFLGMTLILFRNLIFIPLNIEDTPSSIMLLLPILLFYLFQKSEGKEEKMVENRRFIAFGYFFVCAEIMLIQLGKAVTAQEILVFITFYAICGISLNLSTGLVGVLNFGVVFQIALGAVIYALLAVNSGVNTILAIFLSMIITAIISAIIALSTLRLKDDYFAIVSITLGEIFRQLMKTEPNLRGPIINGERPSTPAILQIPLPFKEWHDTTNGLLFGIEIPYRFVIAAIGFLMFIIIYFICERLTHSPYGRILRSIREDDLVTSTYGKNTLNAKVQIMALSGAVAALGGVLTAWINVSVFPESFLPLITFNVWVVYIIGGRGNNKGMLLGATIFVVLNRASRLLDNESSTLFNLLDSILKLIRPNAPDLAIAYLQLIFVGLILILFIRFAPRGVLPERAYRPRVNGEFLLPPGSQVTDIILKSNDNLLLSNEKEIEGDEI
ncbi:MAG: branched-chain amino acid ABC transporter permease [Asgard group archaeon]|nr:branched-chain amino acid ABC transporter permease [Asgard group archaeon]